MIRLRNRAAFFVTVAVATTTLGIAPGAAEPTVSAPTSDAPDPGDVISITIDGTDGYDGAQAIVITSCGNATPYEPDEQYCHEDNPVLVADGDTFSGLGILPGPVDGTSYTVDYEWTEPFMYDGICAATGPQPCLIRVGGIRLDGTAVWGDSVEVSTPQALPRVVVGPRSQIEGDSGSVVVDVPIHLTREVEWWVTTWVQLNAYETNTWIDYPEINPLDLRPAQSYYYYPTFAPGETETDYSLRVYGDTVDEPDESAIIEIRQVDNAEIGGFFGLAPFTILDDDPAPDLVPDSVAIGEGDAGSTIASVTYSLSTPSQKTVEFDYTVAGIGSTTAGVDFIASSGHAVIPPASSTFPPGDSSFTIYVEILGDIEPEPDEFVGVAISNVQNASPTGFFGLSFLEIVNDDAFPNCLDRLLPGEDLSGCDLSNQVFVDLDLSGADLRYTDLRDTFFINSTLAGADLTGAATSGAAFVGVDLTGATVGADGPTAILGSTLDGARLTGDFSGSTLSGGSAIGAVFDGEFASMTISTIDLTGGDLERGDFPGTVWGNATCPDGASSTATGDTCLRVRIQAHDWWTYTNEILLGAPGPDIIEVVVFGERNIVPSTDSQFRFGPTGDETVLDSYYDFLYFYDGDEWRDSIWRASRSDAGFYLNDTQACLSGTTGDGERVWGCTPVTVRQFQPPTTTTVPPISPPASPPISDPVSPGGGFSGVVPLLQGPIGLMATAAGIGMIFLLGSSRASATLDGTRREEDGDVP